MTRCAEQRNNGHTVRICLLCFIVDPSGVAHAFGRHCLQLAMKRHAHCLLHVSANKLIEAPSPSCYYRRSPRYKSGSGNSLSWSAASSHTTRRCVMVAPVPLLGTACQRRSVALQSSQNQFTPASGTSLRPAMAELFGSLGRPGAELRLGHPTYHCRLEKSHRASVHAIMQVPIEA